jgi:Flp pilus assembly protein TadD
MKFLVLLAGAAVLAAGLAEPAVANRGEMLSPYTRYIRARVADAAGLSGVAATQYAAALAETPGNLPLAVRTYRQATVAGDKLLALKSAQLLDRSGVLPPDGRLLLLVDAVNTKNWAAAQAILTKIDQEQVFAFLTPIARAWIAYGSGQGDPMASFAKLSGSTLSNAYGAEHRALILIAQGNRAEAADIIKVRPAGSDVRDVRPRLLLAQSLAAAGDRPAALAILRNDDAASTAMRVRISEGKRIAAPRIDASFGLSQLLTAVAIDLNRERATPLSVTLSRIALFAAPDNSEALLATAQLLAMGGRDETALGVLSQIAPDDVLISAARISRVRILVSRGEKQAALDEMTQVTGRPDASVSDWTLLGDIASSLDRNTDAAAAYGRAIALIGPDAKGDERLWTLWLLKGSVLEQADQWPEAETALRASLALSPEQAVTLNHLGYSLLEHGGNRSEARALIEKASKLRPEDAAITDSLGWSHYLEGDLATAIPKLEAAAEGEPGGSEINEHLGDAYWSAGRRMEARYAWQAAKVTANEAASQRLTQKIADGLAAATPVGSGGTP